MTLSDLANRAARELPLGWQIVIRVELGWGAVMLLDPDGFDTIVPGLHEDDTIDKAFLDALSYVTELAKSEKEST